jgi:hypothetical protein
MTAHVLRISEDNSIEFWSGFDRQMNFLQPIPETVIAGLADYPQKHMTPTRIGSL